MLQIIGWLGCVYLFVKGLELFSSNSHRLPDGKLNSYAITGAIIAVVGSLIFALMLVGQGSASPFPATGLSSDISDENLMTADLNAMDMNATDLTLDATASPANNSAF